MKFIAEDNRLVIRLQGAEKLFGFRSKLIVPRANIISLEWYPDFSFDGRLLRLAGSNIPNVLYAGHFGGGGERYFMYLLRPRSSSWWAVHNFKSQNTLVITTQNYLYKNIFLTCQPDIGAGLLNWWKDA